MAIPQSTSMEQTILDSLQNLQLTKEEEEDILNTSQSRPEILEECVLSLFGRLQLSRQQNQCALKNTLTSAWKMGSELLRWVTAFSNSNLAVSIRWNGWKKNGPWNFNNNLLLLWRWNKGLTAANMEFTHSPFWVQI